MNKLILIRGLPGSGKSTMAKEMIAQYRAAGKTAEMYEADMYFAGPNGEHNFVPEQLGRAHQWCFNSAVESMKENDITIVSNTFVKNKEMRNYRLEARKMGVECEIIEAKGEYGSIHGLSDEYMERRKKQWQEIEELPDETS